MLARWMTDLGVTLHLGTPPQEIVTDGEGAVAGIVMADGATIDCDLVIFSAGIRARDELARDAGLEVGERGGVVVNDTLTTSDPSISAIGEVACHQGMIYGLVAPGYEMAAVLADRLLSGFVPADRSGSNGSTPAASPAYRGSDLSTKLKLLGVDVASFGDSGASADGADGVDGVNGVDELVFSDPVSRVYRRLVLDADGRLIGGALVGDHWPECNELVADDLDPICKIPGFKYTPVRLARVEPNRDGAVIDMTDAATTRDEPIEVLT